MIGGIKNFKFWCQKVLPLVYDNSLSYYEILCKVVHYLNHVIDDMNQIPEYIDEKVREAFDDEHIKELISEVFRTLEDAISANNEGTNTHFSTDYPKLGTLLWHDNKLYKTIRVIDQGDEIIPDVNIELVDFGDMFNDFIDEVKKNFTPYDDGLRETASMDRTVHQLVWLNDVLYEVTKPISEGNAYIYSGENINVVPISLDDIYDYILDLISDEASTRAEEDIRIELELTDLITSKVDIEAGIRSEEDARIVLELSDLITSKVGIEADARENADNTIVTALTKKIDDLSFDTVADMIDADLADGDTVVTLGYYSVNDGGAGVYKIVDSAPDTYYVTLDNGLFGKLITENYNVLQMGAKRDNSVDNTDLINTLLQIYDVLYFPAGTYKIDGTITIGAHKKIYGDGRNTILKNEVGETVTMFYVTGNWSEINNVHIFGVYGYTTCLDCVGRYFRISNFTLEFFKDGLVFRDGGNEAFVQHFYIRQYSGHAIRCSATNDIFINQFLIIDEWADGITNPTGTGIYLTKKCEGITVSDGDIVGGNRAMNFTANGGTAVGRNIPQFCNFTNVYFDSAKYSNIIDSCNDISFTNCWWSFTGQSFTPNELPVGQEKGLHIVRGTNLRFVNCEFVSCAEEGLYIEHGSDIIIENSLISNNNRFERNLPGLDINGSAKNVVVTNSNLTNSRTDTEQYYAVFIREHASASFIKCNLENRYDNTINRMSLSSDGFVSFDCQESALPNYNNQISHITGRNQSYTSGRNNVLIMNIEGDTDGTAAVFVNNVVVARAQNGVSLTVEIPIKRGDVVTTRETAGIYDGYVYTMMSYPV